jgi:hypothetical protein
MQSFSGHMQSFFVVLGYAAYDTACWQRCEALKKENGG